MKTNTPLETSATNRPMKGPAMHWERIFIRLQVATLALATLSAAVWGPREMLAWVLGASPPMPGEVVPRQIPYRGYLEQNGVAVDQPNGLELGFSLYPSDGGIPWRMAASVPVVNGYFAVDLGDDGGIPASLLDDPGVSLGIQIRPSQGGPTLAGTQRLLSVPFSQRAALAWNSRTADIATSATAASGTLSTQIVPPGAIIALAGDSPTPPPGWLPCDGTERSRTGFAALFAVIGTTSGIGDGVTTFNLPDYRGRFLRGADDGTGHDRALASRFVENGAPGSSGVGSVQDDELKEHWHYIKTLTGSGHGGSALSFNANSADWNINTGVPVDFLGFTTPTGGNETHPANVAVRFFIKY